jgi:alpha-tubulin suppressor-like RCC1 family protein
LTSDKLLYCWGNTVFGQCGTDPALTGMPIVGPTRVPGIDNVSSFALVKNHSCAVRSGEVLCWGSNSRVQPPDASYVNGKLGPAAGDLAYSAAPMPVPIGSPVLNVAMGAEATYALTEGGPIYAWGENDRLQLGIESREPIVRTPTTVKFDTGAGLVPLAPVFVPFRTGSSDHCVGMANRTDFEAPYLCWGTDEWGELGAGTLEGARTTHRYPIPVRALPGTAGLGPRGEDHACGSVAVAGRTEIRCYGRPGALGNGTLPAEDGDPPSQWEATPVVWDPANFAPALE